jgi:alpha-tubulin suppressor-like RCC1 family protein
VYSWGYGGSNNIFSQIKNRAGSPLGHSGCNTCLEPKIVENLPGPVSQITAGYNFSLALSEEGKIYGWGSHLPFLSEVPSIQASELSEINFFLERNHGRVLKMRAGEKSAFFLLDNGRIYVVG